MAKRLQGQLRGGAQEAAKAASTLTELNELTVRIATGARWVEGTLREYVLRFPVCPRRETEEQPSATKILSGEVSFSAFDALFIADVRNFCDVNHIEGRC